MVDEVTHFQAYLLTERRVALNTYKAYSADILIFTTYLKLSHASITQWSEITVEVTDNFFKELKRRKFSQKTLARVAATLRLFGNYLKNRYSLTLPLLEIMVSGAEKTLPRACSENDISFILKAYCPEKEQRNHLIIHLLYVTGMRVSELCALELKDVSIENRTLTLLGKRGKQRLVPLSEETISLIKDYCNQSRLNKLVRSRKHFITHLFPVVKGNKSGAITRSMIWRIVKKAYQIACASHPSLSTQTLFPHMFRHSLATHLVKHEWDLRYIQLMLGHENITTVETYTHVDKSHLKNIYRKKHPRS